MPSAIAARSAAGPIIAKTTSPARIPKVKTASPSGKRPNDATPDKDSPFAALLELKEKMARETQDQA